MHPYTPMTMAKQVKRKNALDTILDQVNMIFLNFDDVQETQNLINNIKAVEQKDKVKKNKSK